MLRKGLYILLIFISATVCAKETNSYYSPSKVVYDLSSSDPAVLKNILDRISMLQNVYNNNPFQASIIVVVHEGAIPLFVKTASKTSDLISRAHSLTLGEIIKFKVCEASAKMQGFSKKDFPEFTKMVPMADAEIVMLQNNGYAYLR